MRVVASLPVIVRIVYVRATGLRKWGPGMIRWAGLGCQAGLRDKSVKTRSCGCTLRRHSLAATLLVVVVDQRLSGLGAAYL